MNSEPNSNPPLQAQWSTLDDGRRVVSFIFPSELMDEKEANLLKNISHIQNNPFVRYLELQRDFLILERGLHFLPHQFNLTLYCRYYSYDRELSDLELINVDSEEGIEEQCVGMIHTWLEDCLRLQHLGKLISDLVFDFGQKSEEHDQATHTRDSWTQGLRTLYDAQLGQGAWDIWKAHREQKRLQDMLPAPSTSKSGLRL